MNGLTAFFGSRLSSSIGCNLEKMIFHFLLTTRDTLAIPAFAMETFAAHSDRLKVINNDILKAADHIYLAQFTEFQFSSFITSKATLLADPTLPGRFINLQNELQAIGKVLDGFETKSPWLSCFASGKNRLKLSLPPNPISFDYIFYTNGFTAEFPLEKIADSKKSFLFTGFLGKNHLEQINAELSPSRHNTIIMPRDLRQSINDIIPMGKKVFYWTDLCSWNPELISDLSSFLCYFDQLYSNVLLPFPNTILEKDAF